MANRAAVIEPGALARYLATAFRTRVDVLDLRPRSATNGGETDPKEFGYGVPFEVACLVDALVIAHARWYPALSDGIRTALLRFAQAMAKERAFAPEGLSALFAVAPSSLP